MLDCIIDGVIDTIKLLPYLLITFLILEILEHKLNNKTENILTKSKKVGPLLGGILGAVPQCGFSTMASNLYASKIITTGTLIAIFLSTSDEMLPIMLSEHANIGTLLKIVGFKVIVGVIVGLLVDLFYRRKKVLLKEEIHAHCEHDDCHCEDGIIKSTLIHTLKIAFFILIVNIVLNIVIETIGEEALSKFLLNKNIFTYFVASLIGLIPNCASSVIMTELYLQNMITVGTLLSGLLTGSGLGILMLFKSNSNKKENIGILSFIYIVGVVIGIIVDIII
ncbi:MAG: putative manganese transporter [Bacilli bacterium]|nr:putative manganese transporter [Bacilli bacterium]